MNKTKISKLEATLLFLMFICYLATLFFLLTNNNFYAMIFFVFHSCLTISFFFTKQNSYEKELLDIPSYYPSPREEMEILEQNADTINQLNREKDELLLNKEHLSSEVKKLKEENTRLTVLLSEAQLRNESITFSDSNDLLPPNETLSDVNLLQAARSAIDKASERSSSKGILLSLSSSANELNIRADKNYIRLIFENIIDNSIKYMNRTGSLVITLSNVGDFIFIALKDNGNGLHFSEIEHIFDINYQGANRSSGTGLGLAQVKAIVEHYNGTVYAKSENGMGIYIKLPSKTD